MKKLIDQHIEETNPQSSPLSTEELNDFLKEELQEWVVEKKNKISHLTKIFTSKDFSEALNVATQIGLLAEMHNHHPEITIRWSQTTVSWSTHSIQGIHLNDCIMAAHTDLLAHG